MADHPPVNPPSSHVETSAFMSTTSTGDMSGSVNPQVGDTVARLSGELQKNAGMFERVLQAVRNLNRELPKVGGRSGQGEGVTSVQYTERGGGGDWAIGGKAQNKTSTYAADARGGHSQADIGDIAAGGGGGGTGEPPRNNNGGDSGMFFGAGGFKRVATFYAASAAIQGASREYRTAADYQRAMREQTASYTAAFGTSNAGIVGRIPMNMGLQDTLAATSAGMQGGGPGSLTWRLGRGLTPAMGGYAEQGFGAAAGITSPQVVNRLYAMGAITSREDISNPRKLAEGIMRVAGAGSTPNRKDLFSDPGSYFRSNVRSMVGAENEQAVLALMREQRGYGPMNDEYVKGFSEEGTRETRRAMEMEESTLNASLMQAQAMNTLKDAFAGDYQPWMGALADTLGTVFMSLLPFAMGVGNAGGIVGAGKKAATAIGTRAGWQSMAAGVAGMGASVGKMGVRGVVGRAAGAGALGLAAYGLTDHVFNMDEVAETSLMTSISRRAIQGGASGMVFGPKGGAIGAIGGGLWGAIEYGLGRDGEEGDPPGGSSGTGGIGTSISGGEQLPPIPAEGAAAGNYAQHIGGLEPSFRLRIQKMCAENPRLHVYSGKRSSARQAQLWEEAKEKYGSAAEARKWVAPPTGTIINGKPAKGSNHERGQAADMGPKSQRTWMKNNVARFGLAIPLNNEPWHVEPAGLRSGREEAYMEQEASASTGAAAANLGGGGAAAAGFGGAGTRIALQGDEAAHIAALLGGAGDVGSSPGGAAGGSIGGAPGAGGAAAAAAASGDLGTFMKAIRALESGNGDPAGDYTARGPLITNPDSQYYGEKAYGAYQIMPGNWPSWARAAGIPGANISDPAAQDTVASHMMGQYYDKYKSWEATAIAWFSGTGTADDWIAGQDVSGVNDAQKGFKGTSVPDYVSTIQNFMQEFAEGDPPDGSGRPGTSSTSVPFANFAGSGGGRVVNLNISAATAADAEAIAQRVLRLIKTDDSLDVIGSS